MDYGESTYTNNVKILLFFFSVVVGPYSFVVVVFSFHHSCGPFVSQIKRLIACIFFMKIKYNIRIYEINTKNQQKYTKQIFKTNRNKKTNYREQKENKQCFPSYICNCSYNITITENKIIKIKTIERQIHRPRDFNNIFCGKINIFFKFKFCYSVIYDHFTIFFLAKYYSRCIFFV